MSEAKFDNEYLDEHLRTINPIRDEDVHFLPDYEIRKEMILEEILRSANEAPSYPRNLIKSLVKPLIRDLTKLIK